MQQSSLPWSAREHLELKGSTKRSELGKITQGAYMFGGDFASDMAINGARRRAQIAESRTEDVRVVAQQQADLAEEMILANAQNLGIRFALAEQLQRFDPENPLLKDPMLVERLKAATITAFELADRGFDAAREVGRNFKVPGREGPFVPPPSPARARMLPPTLMKQDNSIMNLAYASTLAHRNAVVEQLKRADPDNPLLNDPFLVESLRTAGAAAYTLHGESFDAAREAGTAFSVPGRK